MRGSRAGLLSDIAFLLFLLLCLICIMFIAGNPNDYMQNIIVLNFAFLCMVITYFVTVAAGLLLNLVFIFGYGSFIVYQTVTRGEAIEISTYFWLVMAPLLTVAMWLYSNSNQQLQAENERLQKQKEKLATLDETTDLKNSLSFQKDITVFSGLSIRYNIPLTLLVIRVKYWNEIRRFIPQDELSQVIHDISTISHSSIRTNDILYLLDNENVTWGLLLFTDKEGSKIVIERIKQKLMERNNEEFVKKYKVKVHLKMGAVEYNHDVIASPLALIEQAQKQLEYDV